LTFTQIDPALRLRLRAGLDYFAPTAFWFFAARTLLERKRGSGLPLHPTQMKACAAEGSASTPAFRHRHQTPAIDPQGAEGTGVAAVRLRL